MEITFSKKAARVPVTVARVRGRIDSSNYHDFSAAARKIVASGAQYLLLDLAGCEYMSSSGIRSLNELCLQFRSAYPDDAGSTRSRRLKLLNPSDKLAGIFSIAGVDAFFEIYSDLETAVASF
ncbi:MAG: STAS domain-containing protein [Chloroflexota bacterium]